MGKRMMASTLDQVALKHTVFRHTAAAFVLTLLAGCATTGQTGAGGATTGTNGAAAQVGKAVLITAVDAKCRTEIQTYKQWQSVARLMSADRRAEYEAKVCSCASAEAVNTTDLTDLILVANPSTREVAVANIAQRTIVSCFSKLK